MKILFTCMARLARTPVFEEFFDLRHDPDELTNLASSPEFAAELKAFRSRTDRYTAELKWVGFQDD